ncbi:unnamed protein product, partial [marine sediment metagenome]
MARTIVIKKNTRNRLNRSFNKWSKQVREHYYTAGLREMNLLGKDVQRRVRQKIQAGESEGPPLAESTVEKKKRNPKSRSNASTKHVEFGNYGKSITIKAVS